MRITNEGLCLEHFEQMEALELAAYDSEFVAPAAEAYEWYLRHPRSAFVAFDGVAGLGERVVGFVNLFPVRQQVYDALMAGTFNDKYLEVDDIVDLEQKADGGQPGDDPRDDGAGQPERLHMFLSCIVVDERMRGKGLAKRLVRTAMESYSDVSDRCEDIVSDNVTEAGARFSRSCGFTHVCESDHDSHIYAGSWSDNNI